MNSDVVQLIGLGVLILVEQYAVAPWQFPVFARMWDYLANFFAAIAWITGRASMIARANYYSVVNSGN
jgi:hypothetical protein